MKFDTFGNTKAAISLANTLNLEEYKKFQKRVASLFSKYNHYINQIDLCKELEDGTREFLLQLIRNRFKNLLFPKCRYDIPDILRGLMFNIFTANYRKAIKNQKFRNDWAKKQDRKSSKC